MQTKEFATGEPRKRRSASTALNVEEVFHEIKTGKKSEQVQVFDRVLEQLTSSQREAIARDLVLKERCSPAFADRLLSDKIFRRRVTECCGDFARQREQMQTLEEAEIYTELMDPGQESLAPLLKTTDPVQQFKGLEPLTPEEMTKHRMMEFRRDIQELDDPENIAIAREVLQHAFSQVGVTCTGTDKDWEVLESKSDRLQHFLALEDIRELYNSVTNGKKVSEIGRRIQLQWRELEDGNRVPEMRVRQYGRNPETNALTEYGLRLEKERRPTEQGVVSKRVVSEIHVVVDKDVRGAGEGTTFLLNNLNLIKAYNLQETKFIANIKLGSYVWTRIADVDVSSMLEEMPPEAKEELGAQPWDEKRAKGLVFREKILPQFEQQLDEAISVVVSRMTDLSEQETMRRMLVDDLRNTKYAALRERALRGELTIEELANLGRGIDVFRFSSEGDLVGADDPDATHVGHLGKAAMMGIPWVARIRLDTKSLFHLVDRMTKGTGFMSYLKKSGKKIGLMLSL